MLGLAAGLLDRFTRQKGFVDSSIANFRNLKNFAILIGHISRNFLSSGAHEPLSRLVRGLMCF